MTEIVDNGAHISCLTVKLEKSQLPGAGAVEGEGIVVVLAGM